MKITVGVSRDACRNCYGKKSHMWLELPREWFSTKEIKSITGGVNQMFCCENSDQDSESAALSQLQLHEAATKHLLLVFREVMGKEQA